ncbi:MAG: hypothetical protein QNJ40_00430 [Xanthomonadales bacterium]|nr:hypothetical protein [Xanthomonadales bacterium]
MTQTRSLPVWILSGVPLVVLWRAVSLFWPSSHIDIPEMLRIPNLLLGMFFLCAGVITFNRAPSRWSLVFVVYCLGSGIHWGGSIGVTPELELPLLFFYMACTLLSAGGFLHLALIYPHGNVAHGWRIALYMPALAAALVSPFVGLLPDDRVRQLLGTELIIGSIMSWAGALYLLWRLITADGTLRRESGLALIVGAVFLAGTLQQLGSMGILPGEPAAWNLILFLIPLAIAVALMSREPAE